MMAYTRDTIPKDHGEFSGGPGLIDPEVRKDRIGLTNEQRLLEIYATNPDPPEVAQLPGGLPIMSASDEVAVRARAKEIERENDPETTPVPRFARGLPIEE